MTPRSLPVSTGFAGCFLALGLLAGCGGPELTEPLDSAVELARGGNGQGGGGGGGGGGPTVNATDPTSAPQDITLDVRVFGSGFDNGSKVTMLLGGKTTTTVRTNRTSFVSATELVTNITISVDAVPDQYDVQVTTTNGKKGIGIELFAVTGSFANFGDRPTGAAPAALYEDGLGTYGRGTFNVKVSNGSGNGNFTIHAWCEDGRAFDLVPPAAWPLIPSRLSVCNEDGGAGQFSVFRAPGLAQADCADGASCPIGGPHDPALGSNFANDLTYYTIEDTNGDGQYKFTGRNPDHNYNVVWVNGSFSVLSRAAGGTPCVWHLAASVAHLWEGSTAIDIAGKPVALDVVVTRTDGVCAI